MGLLRFRTWYKQAIANFNMIRHRRKNQVIFPKAPDSRYSELGAVNSLRARLATEPRSTTAAQAGTAGSPDESVS